MIAALASGKDYVPEVSNGALTYKEVADYRLYDPFTHLTLFKGLHWHSKRQLLKHAKAGNIDILEYTLLIYDNGGKTYDRYTAVFLNRPEKQGLFAAFGMSEDPFHPQGFGQHCSAQRGRHLGKRIHFHQLPVACQRALLNA